MNCWVYMKCGREAGGDKAAELGVCPAYPDNGKRCAHNVGTLSMHGKAAGCVQTVPSCWICDFFRSQNYMGFVKQAKVGV